MIKTYKSLSLMMMGVAIISLSACDDSSKQNQEAAAPMAAETLDETINMAVVNAMAATAFATAQDSTTGAIFLTLQNAGAEDDRLIGATTSKSSVVEIHENVFDDETGVMQMRKIDGLDIPAAGEVELTPKGYHIMLMGLTEPLVEGTSFDVTLDFEKAPDVVVPVSVVSAGGQEVAHDHGDMNHEDHEHDDHNHGESAVEESQTTPEEIAPMIEEISEDPTTDEQSAQ